MAYAYVFIAMFFQPAIDFYQLKYSIIINCFENYNVRNCKFYK